MNRKSRFERIFLAILFCTIAERAIAQVSFERPPLEGAIVFADPPKVWVGQCAVRPAPSIASKNRVPPAPVPDSYDLSSLSALQHAAEDGDPIAQWELGRMYAEGDGVAQNDLLAFDYFSRIANAHGKVSPSAPEAQIVANAFVALGRYYLTGIPNSKITSDPERAREMFSYAASYFGNADAQYDLARLYLKDAGTSRDDFLHGARWLGLAAQKGQHQAQALLGQLLFDGDCLPPQRALGLMWLTLASENADPDETWIKESYNRAVASASESDRAKALQMLEHWVKDRRDWQPPR
jgi:TPR repeat protein